MMRWNASTCLRKASEKLKTPAASCNKCDAGYLLYQEGLLAFVSRIM